MKLLLQKRLVIGNNVLRKTSRMFAKRARKPKD